MAVASAVTALGAAVGFLVSFIEGPPLGPLTTCHIPLMINAPTPCHRQLSQGAWTEECLRGGVVIGLCAGIAVAALAASRLVRGRTRQRTSV